MNKTVYEDHSKNAIRISEFRNLHCETPFRGLGIKYVLYGEETYFVNGKKFLVKEGEYLIGNDLSETQVKIESQKNVRGICIDLSSELIKEIAENHFSKGKDLSEFLLSEKMLVNRYQAQRGVVAEIMMRINEHFCSGAIKEGVQETDLLFSLAEVIISEQWQVNHQMQRLPFKKTEAHQDVLRSLLRAKAHIDDNLSAEWSIETLSSLAGISRFHFIRLFKRAFGTTPYQYLKNKRLEDGRQLLAEGKSVSEVAFSLGYPDLAAFSKAFKQCHGFSPLNWQKSNF
jgi:AraC-like DNA-binding protein